MEIIGTGFNIKHDNDFKVTRANGLDGYLMLIIKSDAYIILNGTEQYVPPDSVIIYKPKTPQFYGARNTAYVNDWIYFDMSEKEYSKYFRDEITPDTLFPSIYVTEASTVIKDLFTEHFSQNKYKNDLCELYMQVLFLKLAHAINLRKSNNNPYYYEFIKLRNEIYLQPDTNLSVNDIANKLSLSTSYLQHLYKQFFSTTVSNDITDSRIEYAKQLLISTDMKVSVIARKCGYNTDVHFMRMFKKQTGKTPSQYRKLIFSD